MAELGITDENTDNSRTIGQFADNRNARSD